MAAPTVTPAQPPRRAASSTTGFSPTTASATAGKFAYHYSQQHAIETLIYLYEVAKVRRQKALIETFAGRPDLKLLQYDDFARYCVKMATGSGKTKVMALAVAWQYFNAVAEARDDYAKTFLLIAPNVIVFERLRTDFAGGRIFTSRPDDSRRAAHLLGLPVLHARRRRAGRLRGALYLTNIQQIHERAEADDDEPDVMTAMLGPKPPADDARGRRLSAAHRRARRPGRRAQRRGPPHARRGERMEQDHPPTCTRRRPGGLAAQFDFTATPRHTKGQLFSWTVFDYPLKQAIIDNIVKRPLKGVAKGIAEQPSEMASIRYQAYLAAGVERWKEYRDQLAPLAESRSCS